MQVKAKQAHVREEWMTEIEPGSSDTESEESYRRKARAWLATITATPADRTSSPDEGGASRLAAMSTERQQLAYDAGYVGITWPKEYGGQGLSGRYQEIFNEEAGAAGFGGLIGLIGVVGLGMAGPTIVTHGTEEQKKRHIPPLLRGDEVWCQMFSEPGAGSDVAGLRTRAVRDGDVWIVNGQKVWTSGAQHSAFAILLARTDPDVPKHEGLTMFILDVRSQGVMVRPLRQMNGDSGFNEIFLDDVRIPHANVVGGVGEGWRVATTTLMNERVSIGSANGGNRPVDRLGPFIGLARAKGLNTDPIIRQEIGKVFIAHSVVAALGLRIRATVKAGKVPGPEGSIAKLLSAQLATDQALLGMRIAGAGAIGWDPAKPEDEQWAYGVTTALGRKLGGGTDQIQRNIIGERVLGLAREPWTDRDVPFRDLPVNQGRTGRA
jgi:acyl-CoA dehydrogenase